MTAILTYPLNSRQTKEKNRICMFYLKMPSLIKIRYRNNQITWGNYSMFWWTTPKPGIIRNVMARDAAHEHGNRKYINFDKNTQVVLHLKGNFQWPCRRWSLPWLFLQNLSWRYVVDVFLLPARQITMKLV